MFTRQQYLNKECTHREYYAQFVSEYIKTLVKGRIGLEALKKSNDKHYNDIPLAKWDSLCSFILSLDTKPKHNDFYSQAGAVCILKEAARQIMEEENE